MDEGEPQASEAQAPEAQAPERDAPEPSARRRTTSLRKKLAFTALIALGAPLLLELALRLAGLPSGIVRSFSGLWNPTLGPDTPGLFKPGAHRITYPRELAYSVRINALGLRGPEQARARPADTLRVLALGDSVTFGYHVADEEAYPARLAALLRGRLGRPVEVLNGGCGHFSLPDERAYLERLLPLDPQLCVLVVCSNDLGERELLRQPTLYEEIVSGASRSKRSFLRETAVGEAQLRLAIALKEWRRRRAGEWPPKGFGEGEKLVVTPQLWARYEQELSGLVARLRAAKVPLVVVLLSDLWELEEGRPAPHEERLAALAARLGLPFASTFAPARAVQDPKTLYLWPLDAHPSARGNELLARVVADLVPRALPAR
ncbi:MAG: SGNH/GDSL hydrolase family protein [Planctomycetota bacterium]